MRRIHVITAVLTLATLTVTPVIAQTTPANPPASTQQAGANSPALAGRFHGLAWRVYRPGGAAPAAAGDTLNVTLPAGARLLGVKWQDSRIIVGFRSTAAIADVSRFYTQRMTASGFRAAGGSAASGLRFTRADDTVVLTITRPAATSYRAVIDLSGVQGDTSRDVNPNQAAAGGTAGGTAAGAAGGSRGTTGTGATGNTSSTGVVGGPESTAELPGQETSGTGAGSGTGRNTNTGDGSGAAANPSGGTGAPSGAAGTTASAGAAAGTTGAAGIARGTTGTAAGAGTTGTGGTAGGRNDQATTGAAQGSAQAGTGNTGTGTTVQVGPGTTPATGTASTANNRADQNYDKVVTATPGKLTLNVLPVGSPVATQASDATFTLVPPRGATRATVNIDGARVFLGYFSDQPLDEQFKYFDDQFTRQGFKRVTGSGANVEATANAKITYRRGNGDVAFELQQFGGENAYRVIADFGNLVDSLK